MPVLCSLYIMEHNRDNSDRHSVSVLTFMKISIDIIERFSLDCRKGLVLVLVLVLLRPLVG